jgi:hypothetical protein
MLEGGLCCEQKKKFEQRLCWLCLELTLVLKTTFLFNMWRAILGQKFGVGIGRSACEACNATRNFGTNSAFVLGPMKTKEKLDRIGRSQDIPNAV